MNQKPSNRSITNNTKSMKFFYSYGGKILPRPSDGKLRYVGGFNRVLSVERSITLSELMLKFEESCGLSMKLKCKLPTEDLGLLITVESDEDLKNVIEEYEKVSSEAKIRAVLFPIKSQKMKAVLSPPPSPVSCFDFPAISRQHHRVKPPLPPLYPAAPPRNTAAYRPVNQYPVATGKSNSCH